MHYFTLCYTPDLDQNMIWYRCYRALKVAGKRRCAQAVVMVHCYVPWVWTHSGPTAITGSERMRITLCIFIKGQKHRLQWQVFVLCLVRRHSSQWMSHKNKPCLKFRVTGVWLWGRWGRAGDEGQHRLAHLGHAWDQFSFSGIRILKKTLQNMSENTLYTVDGLLLVKHLY